VNQQRPDEESMSAATFSNDVSGAGTVVVGSSPMSEKHQAYGTSVTGDDSREPVEGEQVLPTLTAVFDLEEPKVQTDRLLKQFDEDPHFVLSDDDHRQAGQLLRDRDRDLARTRRLVFEAALQRNGRHLEPIATFVLDALPQDILTTDERERLASRERLEASAADELADGMVRRLVEAAGDTPTSDRREVLRRRRLFNALMLSIVLLHRRSELKIEDVIAILSRHLGRAERGTRQATVRQGVELAQLTDPRLTKENVRERLELVRRWVMQLRSATERLQDADERRLADQRKIRELENENVGLKSRIATLDDELGSLREALIDSQKREAGAQAGGRLDLLEVTGQLESWLAGRLTSQLTVAQQALTVEPARIHVADEKLEVALEELEENLKWLRSLA
jgi:hypothetical protein